MPLSERLTTSVVIITYHIPFSGIPGIASTGDTAHEREHMVRIILSKH